MTLLLTRARTDSEPLARILEDQGFRCLIDPLLDVKHLETPLPQLACIAALLATSANGIRAFAAKSPHRDLPVMAVGDASAKAARDLGFETVHSAGGDVDDLARLVADTLDPAAGPLLHMAGSKLAGDLKSLLESAGFTYQRVVLYTARMADALSPQTLSAFNGGQISGVLLFSPRTAACFAELAKKAALDLNAVTAFCLSQNVAGKLTDSGFGKLEVAAEPTQDRLVQAVLENQKN